MQYALFEDDSRHELLPFTSTRPIYDLRCGILTFRERWEKWLGQTVETTAYGHLSGAHGSWLAPEDTTWLNGRFAPTEELMRLVREAEPHTYYANAAGEVLVARFSPNLLSRPLIYPSLLTGLGIEKQVVAIEAIAIRSMPDLFLNNAALIQQDFALLTHGRKSAPIRDAHTRVYGADNIFLEEGVDIKAAILNAEDGVMYFGHGATVQEGAILHGNHAVCDHATINMGAKMRGDSTIGPHCKAGGEVANSILMGYSNKGHDGYLGNSVIGYWCNLGADTNTSNLKNNYATVKLWSSVRHRSEDTGLQFCGLMMGDHSKCGINTMFNTGTVVGAACNIFGGGFPPTYIPAFSWGGADGSVPHSFEKMVETATAVMARRKITPSAGEIAVLKAVYKQTHAHNG